MAELKESPIKKKVLLYSGGMDSLLANFFWEPDIRLYCGIGHRYESVERHAMQKIGLPWIEDTRLSLSDKERQDAIIPLRNLFFISIASFYGDSIALGVLSGEVNGDKSIIFKDQLQAILNKCYESSYWSEGRLIEVVYPIAEYTKAQAIKKYILFGGDVSLLLQTVSCYSGMDIHCGVCSNCLKRYIALSLNGIEERYRDDPHSSPYLQTMRDRLYSFSPIRLQETLAVFPELRK